MFWMKTGLLKLNIDFKTAIDLNEWLKMIKVSISLHTCATKPELHPNTSTMAATDSIHQ